MKRTLSILLFLAGAVLLTGVPAYAAEEAETEAVAEQGEAEQGEAEEEVADDGYIEDYGYNEDVRTYGVLVNGGFINFTGQKPYNWNDRVYVPVRGVFESLGFEVDYDAETKTATLQDIDHKVEITMGNEYFTADGNLVYPEAPQFILNGSFMIPLRAVAEAVGAEVTYNNKTYVVTIKYINSLEASRLEKPYSPPSQQTVQETTAATEETAEATTEEKAHRAFTIGENTYRFYQERKVAQPTYKLKSPFGFTWYVYNNVKSEYYMLGINDDNQIVAFYTQTTSFAFENLTQGDRNVINPPSINGFTIKPYTRKSANKMLDNRLYALFVCDNDYMKNYTVDSSILGDIKTQLFLMADAVRVNEGQGITGFETSSYTTAQKHAEDLSANYGTSSEQFYQRIIDNQTYSEIADYEFFETQCSSPFYFDILDNILTNSDAYQAIIYGGYYNLETGLAYNDVSGNFYYAQNTYVSTDDYYNSDYDYR